jgi:hypothetical protein
MKALPNILTSARLVIALFMFVALAAAAGGVPWLSENLTGEQQMSLQRWAFWAFVVAAVTDFFDGWLARKLDAVSIWGAILGDRGRDDPGLVGRLPPADRSVDRDPGHLRHPRPALAGRRGDPDHRRAVLGSGPQGAGLGV